MADGVRRARLASLAFGVLFAYAVQRETSPPSKRAPRQSDLPRGELARVVLILTLTSTCGSLLFNFTTNATASSWRPPARDHGDPAVIGSLLGWST